MFSVSSGITKKAETACPFEMLNPATPQHRNTTEKTATRIFIAEKAWNLV
jgi:hypothetical protein